MGEALALRGSRGYFPAKEKQNQPLHETAGCGAFYLV
jgi:hypothetical protein